VIVLADDHPLLRSGVKALLQLEPDLEVVAETDDGDGAVALATELQPDVIVMDVSLPGIGGIEATRRIRAASTKPRVLALSVHEDHAVAQAMRDAGAAGYALKRCAGDELVRAVRTVAAGATYIDPSLTDVFGDGLARGRRSESTSVHLSEREGEVLRLIVRGHTSKEMAESLGISPRTLETYRARAMSKLGLRTRAELVRYAMHCGWLN
jgi:DNA-binding NarL/FixJ family response regulator